MKEEHAAAMICGYGVIRPSMCDAMGHMSTPHYQALFDDAAYQLLAAIGHFPLQAEKEGWGWADVAQTIEYKAETRTGMIVAVEGTIARLGRTSLDTRFRILDRSDDATLATMAARTVCFDLNSRRPLPVPGPIRTKIAAAFPVCSAQASA